jgi:hypothetical protein
VKTSCSHKVRRIVWSKRVRLSSGVSGTTQEVGHHVFVAFDVLAGEAMRAAGDEAS